MSITAQEKIWTLVRLRMWVENKPKTNHVKSVCFSCGFVRGASSTDRQIFFVLVTFNNGMRGRFTLHCVEGPVNCTSDMRMI